MGEIHFLDIMQTQKTITEKIVDSGKKSVIAIIKTHRTINGTVLYVKSPMFEDFFKSNFNQQSGDTIENCEGEQIAIRKNIVTRGSIFARNFDEPSNSLLNSNGDYSLGFLRCDGIGNGIEFPIRGLNSKEAFELYHANTSRIISAFYTEFMKSTTMTSKIQVIEDTI